MKRNRTKMLAAFLLLFCLALLPIQTQAKGKETIKQGVYAGSISLAGMTEQEARDAVTEYVTGLEPVEITLLAANNNEVVVTAGELGIAWDNPGIIEEAAYLGSSGNIVQRYKTLKDLEHENKVFTIALSFDIEAINRLLTEECAKFDQKAVDMSLTGNGGNFTVVEGQTGYLLDVESSIDIIYDYLTAEWNHEAADIALDIAVAQPRGTMEELSKVKDVMATFSTSYRTSSSNRRANVENGSKLINGTLLYPGDEFSSYDKLAPFTDKHGYYMAGAYLNGKVVDSLGGGICQVTTTLYNAVLLSELDVTERYNHSMIVTYVDPSADAAISESAGKDFRFVNNTGSPIYIESYTTPEKDIVFTVYGKEYRSPSRTVTYESEILEVTNPPADAIYADAGQPLGSIVVEAAHIGYKAKLWKVVREDGKEISRTLVNSSSYKMTPRSATVGVATADPNAYNEIMAAIGTSSIDHVKNVIAILTAAPPQTTTGEDE